MPPLNKWNIAQGLIAISVVCDVVRQNKVNKAARAVMEENEILHAALKASLAQTQYLSHMLDENDVPISEFDRIAMHNL